MKLSKRGNRRTPFSQISIPYLFISLWMVGFFMFTVGPILFSLVMSFFDWPIVGEVKFRGLGNYMEMFFEDEMFFHSLFVTLRFVALFTPLHLLIALGLALLLRQEVKGVRWFKTFFYLPSVISGVALAIIWIWLFDNQFGVVNYLLSLLSIDGPNWLGDPQWALPSMVIASLWGQGTMILIFLTALKEVPGAYYEASRLDGAGPMRRFFFITLPLITPSILFNSIITLISAFQQLTLALLMTSGGPMNTTYFYAMYVYNNAFKHLDLGYAAANSWFMFLLIMLLTLFILKSSSKWVYYESSSKLNLPLPSGVVKRRVK